MTRTTAPPCSAASGSLVNRFGTFVVPFLAIYLARQRGPPASTVGVVLSFFGGGLVVSGLVAGVLADRLGRRFTMLLALGSSGAAAVALGLARSPVMIALLVFALGVVGEMYRPAAMAMVADLVPGPRQLKAYGLVYWANNLGFSLAAVAGGVLANRDFQALFVADATTSLVAAAIIWWGTVESRPEAPREADPSREANLWTALSDRTFAVFLGFCFLLLCVHFQATVTLPLDLAANGISPAHYGGILAVNGLTVVLFQLPANWLLERLDRPTALALGAALIGLGFGVLAWIHTVPLYAASVLLWSLGEIIALGPPASATVASLAPPVLRGRYQGLFAVSFGTANLAGSAAGGALLGHFGSGVLWSTCLLVGAAVAVGHLAMGSQYRRRTAGRRRYPDDPLPSNCRTTKIGQGPSGERPLSEGSRVGTSAKHRATPS